MADSSEKTSASDEVLAPIEPLMFKEGGFGCPDSFVASEPQKCEEKFFYTIAAPKSFRPNTDFNVKVTLFKGNVEWSNPEPIVVSVVIEDDRDENPFRVERTATLKLNATENIALPISGDVSFDATYRLMVKAIQGAHFTYEASLDVQTKKKAILVQTDKGMYKPSDKVKFRVIVLDENLRPAVIDKEKFTIFVVDSCTNRIKQWNNVNCVDGVFTDEFQLSDLPNFGKWTLTVDVGTERKEVHIEVEEYVLPKFEVTVEASKHYSLHDENIQVIVRGKYTHGNPVRGKAVVSVLEDDQYGCFFIRQDATKQKSLLEKTVDVDGSRTVELSIAELKLSFGDGMFNRYKEFKIQAEMTEELTGCSQSAKSITVQVHRDRYEIKSNFLELTMKPEHKVTAKITVRNHDDSNIIVNDSNKKISVIRKVNSGKDFKEEDAIETVTEIELDANGDAHYLIETKKDEKCGTLKVKYLDQEEDFGFYYVQEEPDEPEVEPELTNITVKVLTEKCHLNEPIEIEISSPRKLDLFSYFVIGRGKIIESKTVELAADAGLVYRFSFVATFDMAPDVDILVYYVEGDALCSSRTTIDLTENLNNFIELNVEPDTVKPGELVDINIESNAKSFVGLVGVDQSVLLLKDGNTLVQDQIWNELRQFHTQMSYAQHAFFIPDKKKKFSPQYYNKFPDFNSAGLILFTNVREPVVQFHIMKRKMCRMIEPQAMLFGGAPFGGPVACSLKMSAAPMPIKVAPKIRKEFPETWLWQSIGSDAFNGMLAIRKKAPDTITSWIITGFAVDAVHGLGITKTPSTLKVHQPFFVSLNLPYSVKRGEVVSVPCTVFNYLDRQVDVDVTLENQNDEFVFTSDTLIVADTGFSRTKKTLIDSQKGATVTFAIRPTKVGVISLKVVATSSIAGDAVIKTLNVESEGVTQFVNKAIFVDLRETERFNPVKVSIDIPDEALADSTRIEINCLGDLLGGTIKNLQKLIRLPYGCGEQNMLNFVPNIVVLNYLIGTHQLTPEIEATAKKYMEIGYQRELTYKHADGSYSAFGQSDRSGSTWLTAFVAKSFRQAATHITIEEKTISNALEWLSHTQADDGSFREKGSICHKEMQGGSSNGLALTAYVLCAFLENRKQFTQYESVIEKALQNIVDAAKTATIDVYALSVAAFALHQANHESRNNVLNSLLNAAKTKENFKWWDKNIEVASYGHRESKTLNVEITAYGLLSLLLADEEAKCMPILKWLLNQRNSEGGFEGTQDTIVGIDALARLAAKIVSKENNVNIKLSATSASGNVEHSFVVDAGNGLVRQSQTVSADVENVTVDATGRGFALVEVSYKYNIKDAESDPAFVIKQTSKLVNAGNMELIVDTSFQVPPNATSNRSSMTVVEVSLPSGFVVDTQSLEKLKSSIEIVKKVETKNDDTLAVIYFDHLSKDAVSLKLNAFRNHMVTEQKPVPIVVYDYYDSALSAREFYLPEGLSA